MTSCKNIDFLELSNEILNKGNCLRFRARGGSMFPFIRDGDVLKVKPAEVSAIKLGDVIFYRTESHTESHIVAHRVIKKVSGNGKAFLITKGDSSPGLDQYVHQKNILGKVVTVERNGRSIRLNRGWGKLVNFFLAKISPFSRYIYPVLRKIKLSME